MTQPHQSAVTSLPPRSQPSRDDAFPRQHAQVTRPESESQGNEAASGDKPTTTPLSVLTNLNCGRALYHKRDEEDSNSSLPPSSASISVPISAVRQTPTTRRLLSPNSVTARFSRPKHPYLTEDRRAISSTWTSPAIMTAVDRRPSLSATHSLEAGFQEDQAVATFPISPLVMSSPTSTGMRRERRKAAPSWPDSPRGPAGDRAARDAVGLDSPGYLQTPSILRNIPPPTATPTHSQFLHTPLTAGYKTPFFSSAPPLSNARGEPSASSSKQPLPARDRRRQEGIPKSYFVKSLHNLAPNFWNKPATADCRVLIPIRGPGQTTPSPNQHASFSDHPAQDVTSQRPPSSTPQLYGGVSPALVNTGAFASTQTEEAPESAAGSQTSRKLMTFNLHRDYLVSQSALFAELLDDRPPIQKASSSHQVPPPSAPSDVTSFVRSEHAGRSSSPRRQIRPATAKGARILQTPAHVPTTIWLPLPDPASFAVLAHVLYWGDASVLETALARGEVTWQGVVKNTEYLGFDNAIKRILGSWFRRWVKVSAGRTSSQGRAESTTAVVQRRRSGNDCDMQSEDDADFFGPAVSMPRRRSENNATVLSPSGTGAQTPVMEGVDENADAEVVVNLIQGL